MASQFFSLDDAAKKLGISSERLIELRGIGKIRGFRDGASWKFPENEIDRLANDLASESGAYNPYKGLDDGGADEDSDDFGVGTGGSGVLVEDVGSGSGSRKNKIIGGDSKTDSGSDVGVGAEKLARSGSDVNLIAGDSNGSDVMIVASSTDSDGDFLIEAGGPGLVEIDSGELQLSPNEPVISHDSAVLDLAIEPNSGSTGPITDKELRAVAKSNPDLMVGKKPTASNSGMAFDDDEDSGDDLIGASGENNLLDSDIDIQSPPPRKNGKGSASRGAGASSLELMDDLDLISGSSRSNIGSSRGSRGVDVLSELDLLSGDSGGSGLITGDSGSVLDSDVHSGELGSSGLGSRKGGSKSKGSGLNFDDALSDDDDLVIADDEDDLVLGGGASDVSVSGDSGINLMSPSDSGLSLESEPLDLAGSSISALDLGAEIGSDIGSGSGVGSSPSAKPAKGRGSAVDFQDDEDFRLSPSGLGIETDADSNSQVIEIEDSSAFADADAFGDSEFDEGAPIDAGFDDEAVAEAEPEQEANEGFGVSATAAPTRSRASAAPVHEIPFTIYQVSTLMVTLLIMCLGGMLMTDLLRNMWAYSPTEAPVSSLTNALVELANLGG